MAQGAEISIHSPSLSEQALDLAVGKEFRSTDFDLLFCSFLSQQKNYDQADEDCKHGEWTCHIPTLVVLSLILPLFNSTVYFQSQFKHCRHIYCQYVPLLFTSGRQNQVINVLIFYF